MGRKDDNISRTEFSAKLAGERLKSMRFGRAIVEEVLSSIAGRGFVSCSMENEQFW